MRLIATCMASNEADVIEAFVRHNLRYLDAIVVLDHCSLDNTRDILAQLVQEGLPVTLLADSSRAFLQSVRQTQLAHQFMRSLDADYCFVLDADEFIKCSSRSALEGRLRDLPENSFGLLNWQNYVPDAAGSSDAHVLRRITLREASPSRPVRKVVLNRLFAQSDQWQVALGNHFAIRVAEGKGQAGPHVELEGVHLAHFPVRSGPQIARKALLGWLAHRLTNPDKRVRNVGGAEAVTSAWHWGELYGEVLQGETFDGEKLQRIAMKYYMKSAEGGASPPSLVRDPVAAEFDLRHTPSVEMPPLAAMARWTEGLIEELLRNDAPPKPG